MPRRGPPRPGVGARRARSWARFVRACGGRPDYIGSGAPSRHPPAAPPARRAASGGGQLGGAPPAALVSVSWRCPRCLVAPPSAIAAAPRPRACCRAALGSGVGGWVRPPSGCGLACGVWWPLAGPWLRCALCWWPCLGPCVPAWGALWPRRPPCGRAAGSVVVGGRSARGPAVGGFAGPPRRGLSPGLLLLLVAVALRGRSSSAPRGASPRARPSAARQADARGRGGTA